MAFNADRLYAVLQTLPAAPCYWVAYSGGRDSQVLLHALAVLRDRYPAGLRAVHVDHGLHADAQDWCRHCVSFCASHGIPISVLDLRLAPNKGESVEAVAREARYRAIAGLMGRREILLTAHHQDDQAETVLLQLLRGSGLSGLSGMPGVVEFGPGLLARPLLGFTREQLAGYAASTELDWVEDSSNEDTGFDRNFVRHQIVPLLAERWPAMSATLSRSAKHCAEAQHIVAELATDDFIKVATTQARELSVSKLKQLTGPRRRAVLRHWFRKLGYPLPDKVHLDRISKEVLAAQPDRMPQVAWSGIEVRRYRDRIYAMPVLQTNDAGQRIAWHESSSLRLPAGLGVLEIREAPGHGIDLALWKKSNISVRFRRGGERCRPVGRGHTHRLKKLFQEQGIPPWQRDRIPLLFLDDQLAGVPGFWLCESFQAARDEAGVEVIWLT